MLGFALSMESIPCIFGHGYSDQVVVEESGFQGRRCPACGLIFVSPRPTLAQAAPPATQPPFSSPDPIADLIAQTQFQAIYNQNPIYHTLHEKPLSILEISCGAGHFLRIAKRNRLEPFGIEPEASLARVVRDELGIPCENALSPEAFGGKNFDLIFLSNLTRGLLEPIRDFEMIREKLKPHGQLIFETNNHADIDPRYHRLVPAWNFPQHLFSFGEKSIRELLRRTGFTRTHIVSWSTLPEFTLLRPFSAQRNGTGGTIHNSRQARPLVLQKLAAHLRHFARYDLGAFSSNRRVPRSMLVWAMK